MSSLPQEIQEEIILRLPVESIARFKCVCKSWNTYITSPRFIKDHLIRTSRNPRIIIRDTILGRGRHKFHIVDFDSISSSALSSSCKCEAVVRLNYPVLIKDGVENCYINFMGSCNGLLCLEAPGCPTPILWNPSTGEYKEIIPPTDCFGLPSRRLRYRWPPSGFCYDGEIDDYKLVCVSDDGVYVYTLKSGSWRKLDKDIPCVASVEPVGLLLNGALHWTLATATGEISDAIVAFDISSEKARNFRFPEELIPRQTSSSCHLRVLGDSLCIVCGVSARRVDAWVMKNYGVTESWTKLFTTTQEAITKQPRLLKFYWNFINGDILMEVQGGFGFYDQKNDRTRFLNINGLTYDRASLFGESYVESLVSLNSGTYMTRDHQLETKYVSSKRIREEIEVLSSRPYQRRAIGATGTVGEVQSARIMSEIEMLERLARMQYEI